MVFAHLERLFDQPPLQQESAFGLRKLIDSTNESVRALENLNHPETRRRLELSLTDKRVPTFERLIELLEQQSIALDTMSPSKGRGKPVNDPQKLKNLFRIDKGNKPVGNARVHAAAVGGKTGSPTHQCNSTTNQSQVLLATAVVEVKDNHGSLQTCRVLLDTGSQASLITASGANKLGLKRKEVHCQVTGIAASGVATANSMVSIQISSRVETEFTLTINALVLQKVTGDLPTFTCNPSGWKHLSGLRLADPLYYKTQAVDALLGADVLPEILRSNIIRGPKTAPTAQETALGWIVYGPTTTTTESKAVAHFGQFDLNSTLQRFWELEDVSSCRRFTAEEKSCEGHYESTHTRNPDGSYTVRLPFKETAEQVLGKSYESALRRFKQLERRLASNSGLKERYVAFMQDYFSMGHMELVPEEDLEIAP
ncbi:unnamed protein product, partial [Allacma fusca]